MKTKLILTALMVSVLPTVTACSSVSGASAEKEASIQVSADEFATTNGITRGITLSEGDTVTVSLGSNPSTGFSWPDTAQVADPAVVRQVETEFVTADGQLVGAPGTQVWTFRALKKGSTTVSMEYSRPWEGGEKGVWTFDLTVTVK